MHIAIAYIIFSAAFAAPGNLPGRWDCPSGLDANFNTLVYRQGTIGVQPLTGKAAYPVICSFTVEPPLKLAGEETRITIDSGPLLSIEQAKAITDQSEQEFVTQSKNQASVSVGAATLRKIQIRVPVPERSALPTGDQQSKITIRLESANQKSRLQNGFLLTIKNPAASGTIGIVLTSLLALVFLVLAARKFKWFSSFTSSQLTTAAVFSAFFAAGGLIAVLMRMFAFPGILTQFAWDFYYFSLILCCVRVTPRPGALIVSMTGGYLISGILFFGLSPITLLTWVLPGAVVLEVWFALTGYAETRFSSTGAAVAYLIAPASVYWFVTAPFLFHYYYAGWYVALSLLAAAASYILPSLVSHNFARRLGEIVR